jgi:hypothetical protein
MFSSNIGSLCDGTLAKLWNKLDHFQSAAASGDRLIDVFHVGIEMAEIAFGATFTWCSDRARLYHFEEIKPGGRTNFRSG